MVGTDEPASMPTPEALSWRMRVILGIRPSVMVAVKAHPQNRRTRMQGAKQGEQPTHPELLDWLEGVEAFGVVVFAVVFADAPI